MWCAGSTGHARTSIAGAPQYSGDAGQPVWIANGASGVFIGHRDRWRSERGSGRHRERGPVNTPQQPA
jgi:hypothetical protein